MITIPSDIDTSNFKVPPKAQEAENSVIGAILLDNNSYHNVIDIVSSGDFYDIYNQQIFEAIFALIENKRPADVVTVYEYLKNQKNELITLSYLNDLAQHVPSISNIRRYAELVREKSILRMVISAGNEIAASGFNTKGVSAETILDDAQKRILSIGEQSKSNKDEVKSLNEQVLIFIDNLEKLATNPESKTGIFSGFTEFDELTNGFQPGDLIVLAGRPSMGKTALGLNIAQHVSFVQKLPVLVISLEMNAQSLTKRVIASVGRINLSLFQTGGLAESDWGRVSEALQSVDGAILDIEERSTMHSMSVVRSFCRRWKRKNKNCGLIMIDYLQLMGGDDHAGKSSPENRATELGQISRGLKLLSKEMDCPILALSQLNRSVEGRPDKRPLMSDLRESGAIEQDADTIIFVYRDDYYTKDACKEPGIAEIIFAKQRNGPVGTVKLAWQSQYTRFSDR